jgi:hypothetical protein
LLSLILSDRRGLAEVIFLHGHTTASLTNIFHGRQLVFADMFGVRLHCPAEAALGFVVTGVAKMAGCIGYCAAIFTCVRHWSLLFLWVKKSRVANDVNMGLR